MIYAIIAAGKGTRLKQEGVSLPKPMVKVGDETLIHRLIRIFSKNDASQIYIIINESDILKKYIENLQKEFSKIPIHYIIKETTGSFQSLYELSFLFKGKDFCLTTVDTIFSELEFSSFIYKFQNSSYDGVMAVTDYIDDEKPLYISVDQHLMIKSFDDKKRNNTKYISGGIYGLKAKTHLTLEKSYKNNCQKMRDFQRNLLLDNLKLEAKPFTKIFDIDHVHDISQADFFIKNEFLRD